MKGKFDIMIDGGDRYYGTISGDFKTTWKMVDGEVKVKYDHSDVLNAVYKRYPTLRRQYIDILPDPSNKAEI